MSTFHRLIGATALGGLLLAVWLGSSARGQQTVAGAASRDPNSAIRVSLPSDVPLSIVSRDFSGTDIYTRGGAIVIDLRCNLLVRNESAKNVRGVTFAVLAQQMTAGGKASVAVVSLNIAPGGSFPVRLSLRLLRPLPGPASPLVEVTADGVLFEDFSFFGPDQLGSRRKMTVWEREAKRDREFFKAVLESSGSEGLREVVLGSLDRQRRRPRLEVRLAGGGGRTVSSAAGGGSGEQVQLALLNNPDSPLELLSGAAQVAGASAGSPRIRIRNRSDKSVRYFELGWLVSDPAGTQYAAGSVRAPASDVPLAPGYSLSTSRERRFTFATKAAGRRGTAFSIGGMSGYVSQVQFEDGDIWIPTRASLQRASLEEAVPVSAEEQRLTDLYRTKGIKALIEELAQF